MESENGATFTSNRHVFSYKYNSIQSTPQFRDGTTQFSVVLGPSPMESGGARILAALDPCVLTDGGVVLNIPDEQGIQVSS